MQITFDPLNEDEANFVARIVSRAAVAKPALDYMVTNISNHTHSETIRPEDAPDVGAEAPSAVPLPPVPAPSTAAATLFPTAPAAPQASVPPAPPVPSPPVPAAPPPAPAPTANAAPVPPAGDVDSTGLPWDERIHASTKTMNADGTWRQRRGLNDPGLVKRVEAELRAGAQSAGPLSSAAPATAHTQAPTVPPAPPAPNVVAATVPTSTASAPGAVAVSQPGQLPTGDAGNVPPAPIAATVVVPPPPVTPVIPVAVPAPPVPAGASSVTMTAEVAAVVGSTGAPSDFGNTMNIVTKLIAAGLVKEEGVNAVLLSVGLNPNQIGVLAGDPAKTQQVADALRALVGA